MTDVLHVMLCSLVNMYWSSRRT